MEYQDYLQVNIFKKKMKLFNPHCKSGLFEKNYRLSAVCNEQIKLKVIEIVQMFQVVSPNLTGINRG